jgi:hypothetical protein
MRALLFLLPLLLMQSPAPAPAPVPSPQLPILGVVYIGITPVPETNVSGAWSLSPYVPIPTSIACYDNGLRQLYGVDYALNWKTLTSATWRTGDTLLCDFGSAPPVTGAPEP